MSDIDLTLPDGTRVVGDALVVVEAAHFVGGGDAVVVPVPEGMPMARVAVVLVKMDEPSRVPDWSPGDVIAAEEDGTITLDDGITTWNPERARAFLTRGDG